MKRFFVFLFSFSLLVVLNANAALAHVVVRPSEVGKAAFQTFTMGVPNEKDTPTVALRLIIPDGLMHVSPTVKPGWMINVKKEGEGESAKVTEISWTGGSVPSGQRDDFTFSAQAPADETSLMWKAYQTYQSGAVVSWDQDPVVTKNASEEEKEKMEQEGKGPFSQTAVVNDLVGSETSAATSAVSANAASPLPLWLSSFALIVSAGTFWMAMKK